MSATQTTEPKLDWDQLYLIFNLMPGPIEGFDRQGNPLDKRGKVMPVRESQKFILQHGRVFDEAGALVEKPPRNVVQMVEEMREKHPQPGITHAGRVWRCPVPGCSFVRSKEEHYREHKRLHKEISTEQWARLEGAKDIRQVVNLSDFQDPSEVMHHFTEGVAGTAPVRESPQGDG